MSDNVGEAPRLGSLRGAYSPVATDWTFVEATPLSGPSAAAGSVPASSAPAWSAGPTPSRARVLDLSPYPIDDLDPSSALDTKTVFKWLVSAGVLQYATTGIAMPFEVAKILMQCQWIPKDAIEGEFPGSTASPDAEEDEDMDKDDSMSDASAESYFHDPAREAFSTATRYDAESSQRKLQQTDAEGYVLRQSINDASTRPDYVMAVGPTDGVWSMIKRIREFKPEGWTSLWKSQLTSTVLETLTPLVQAGFQTFLLGIFTPESALQAYPIPPSRLPPSHLLLSLASHILTGVLLSPLDLVRTRLIVQSSHPSHRTYTGPFDALGSILRTEGGFRGIYTHPAYFLPTILDNTVRPLLTLSTPIFLYKWLGVEEDTHPLSYAIASCACASAALLVTLPIETVRRRMQVQSHGTSALGMGSVSTSGIQPCVELSPRPYVGVLDTAWRIVTEERGAPRRRRRRPLPRRASTASNSGSGRRPSFKGKERADPTSSTANTTEEETQFELEEEDDHWFASTGIAQLYRGFSMGLTANAVVFALSAFSGFAGDDAGSSGSGWTEL